MILITTIAFTKSIHSKLVACILIMQRVTKNLEETQALATEWVKLLGRPLAKSGAMVMGLSGDLGSGKTSFVQGVARALGLSEHVTSPTFILEKIYKLSQPLPFTISHLPFTHLIHIDAYRLEGAQELSQIGFEELAKEKNNLILIEWPERISEGLPFGMPMIKFEFIDENIRKIEW